MPARNRHVAFLALPFLAGCADGVSSGPRGESAGESGTTGGSSSGGASSGSAGAGAEPGAAGAAERPYAHVVAVSAIGGPGAYSFAVSVESADIDCTQYADWWEVLREGGSLAYRRILEHSHTDENGTSDANAPGNTFTRSGGPVPVAAGEVVIVRAHMNDEGYNGRALRGTPEGGFEEALVLDADFAAAVEREPPQPNGCAF